MSGPVAVTQTKLKLSFITGAKEERGFERKQPSMSPLLKLTVLKSYQLKKKLNINIGENLNYFSSITFLSELNVFCLPLLIFSQISTMPPE